MAVIIYITFSMVNTVTITIACTYTYSSYFMKFSLLKGNLFKERYMNSFCLATYHSANNIQ